MQMTQGKTRFTEYPKMDISVYFARKRSVDTLQFTFGGWCESELEETPRQFKLLKHGIRQILYNKSKDGYYKNNFLFVPKITDNYYKVGKGLIYFDVFLFLEETYEKAFILEHLKTVFDELNHLYCSNKFFKFRKYGKIKES